MFAFVRSLVGIFFCLFYRITVSGVENVPQKGGAILCANHLGQMDMFLIGYKLKRKIRWMAKEELFRNPVLGSLLRFLGAFSVRRGRADINSVKTAYKLIEQGHIVGIFPEAHRMRGKQRDDAKVKHGAAMIAVNTGAPVIPVAIDGSYKFFSRIKVIIGKPFYLNSGNDDKYSKEQLADMSVNIMKSVYGLLEES